MWRHEARSVPAASSICSWHASCHSPGADSRADEGGGERMEPANKDRVRIGAIADLHYTKYPEPGVREMLTQAGRECDVLLLGGDLTDHGLPEEAQGLAREIHSAVGVPVIAVLGNHDYEAGKPEEVKK